MRYQKMNSSDSQTSYLVTDGQMKAAEFSYCIVGGQFWLENIQLSNPFLNYERMDAVLQFIQYKCWNMGFKDMYVKVNGCNLLYMELYKRYGFYIIAEERREVKKGAYTYEYVLKYPLPQTREEAYYQYIRRS